MHCSWERLATPRSSGRPDSHPDFRKQETERSAGAYPTADETMIRDHSRLWTDYFWATASNSAQFGSIRATASASGRRIRSAWRNVVVCRWREWTGSSTVARRCGLRRDTLLRQTSRAHVRGPRRTTAVARRRERTESASVARRCGLRRATLRWHTSRAHVRGPRRTSTAVRRRERPESSTVSVLSWKTEDCLQFC